MSTRTSVINAAVACKLRDSNEVHTLIVNCCSMPHSCTTALCRCGYAVRRAFMSAKVLLKLKLLMLLTRRQCTACHITLTSSILWSCLQLKQLEPHHHTAHDQAVHHSYTWRRSMLLIQHCCCTHDRVTSYL
jgi:hypothetical protein